MKKLVYGLILMMVVALCHDGVAAAALNDSAPFLGLDGVFLTAAEMEGIVGGLPRCCHHPRYDAIEDKCLNNKGQKYNGGVNDCDIWVENNLREAGIDIASRWGPAKTTSVRGHMERLKGELTATAPLGWSIEFIDNTHVALVRVNEDGSADLYHQGFNKATPTSKAWQGSRGYHYPNSEGVNWGTIRSFWKL